jgi:hypothetical protein
MQSRQFSTYAAIMVAATVAFTTNTPSLAVGYDFQVVRKSKSPKVGGINCQEHKRKSKGERKRNRQDRWA